MSASREKKKRQSDAGSNGAASVNASKKGLGKTGKTVLYAILAVVVVAAIVFFGMVSTGFFVTHTVAATVGGHDLSPAMVNYFYNTAYQNMADSMGDYLSVIIDTEKPLDDQPYMTDEFDSWGDYLTDTALKSAHEVYAVYDEAMANGYTLSEDEQASIDSQIDMLDLYGSVSGYSSGTAYLAGLYGTGSTVDSYREYLTINMIASSYAQQIYDGFTYTAEDLDAYYQENTQDFDAVTFRVYSINVPTAEEGEEVDTEAALAECETKAKEMAEASQGDEQAYLDYTVEFADEDSKETYEDDTTTLREDYTLSNCLELYRDWLADSSRQPGDTTYVQNEETGYYVLYFVGQVDRTYQLPNVRDILIPVSDTTDEEAMATAKEKAQTLLDDFLAGDDVSEDAFAALTEEDTSMTGTLYENLVPGTITDEVDSWCQEEGRTAGDTNIFEGTDGYHVVYFSGYGDVYRDYLVENTMRSNDYSEWQTGVVGEASYTTYGFGMRFTTKR